MSNQDIKFRYVYKNVQTGKIRAQIFTLSAIEDSGREFIQPHAIEILISRDRSIGLQDKDGRDIYERDKVSVPADYGGDHWYPECIAEVRYEAPEFYLHNSSDKWGMVLQDFQWDKIEVIGNVYE